MTTFSSEEEINLIGLITSCPTDLCPRYYPSRVTKVHADGVELIYHILGLIYETWSSSFSDLLTDPAKPLPLEFIKCTTELQRAGIKFEKSVGCDSWLDSKFKNGVIKIPPLVVGLVTKSVFKNLIAYEEYKFDPRSNWKCVTDYVVFMDSLIKSSNDVKKLRHHQIIENWLGGDERVCAMFENLGKNVFFHSTKFCYSRVFKDVNICTKQQWNVWIAQWNIWIANLRRTYFKTPWSVISFMAAVALLLLTCIQTIFAILRCKSVPL
ncbi:hypothetical protein ACH5RR_031645 [Cinchona calisaya]|uniref:Uncharacterized protein n=1 Tax=Cinchona calisaya TaxID=153742 RepID=A0ABD2YFU8_9GENT